MSAERVRKPPKRYEAPKAPAVDIQVENHGSIFLFRPLTEDGKAWIEQNVQAEGWQWFGNALAVEHRYAYDLAQGAQADGLVLR